MIVYQKQSKSLEQWRIDTSADSLEYWFISDLQYIEKGTYNIVLCVIYICIMQSNTHFEPVNAREGIRQQHAKPYLS